MEEQRVRKETAILAQKKGFDETVYHYYHDDFGIIPIPTQSVLQKWLRKKHGIYAREELAHNEPWNKENFRACITTRFKNPNDKEYWNYRSEERYDSLEQAVEEALQEALKLIKNEM